MPHYNTGKVNYSNKILSELISRKHLHCKHNEVWVCGENYLRECPDNAAKESPDGKNQELSPCPLAPTIEKTKQF